MWTILLQLKAYVRYSKFTPFNSFTKDRNDEIAVFVERTREKHGNPGLRQASPEIQFTVMNYSKTIHMAMGE